MTRAVTQGDEVARITRLQDFARSHPTRLSILALVAKNEGRSLDPPDLGHDLPKKPDIAVVSYHLGVLRSAHLLPLKAPGKKSDGSTA